MNVVAAGMLPSRLLVVTDRRLARRALEDVVADAAEGGARWFWLRDRDMPRDERRRLAQRLAEIAARYGATLTIGGDVELALEIGPRAFHAPAQGDVAAARQALGPSALIGASAHSIEDARRAMADGADYVTLSPIFATASKPGYGPPLGLDALTRAKANGLRAIALGGIDGANMQAALRAGAAGVAAMGAVMRGAQPGRVIAELLAGARAAG